MSYEVELVITAPCSREDAERIEAAIEAGQPVTLMPEQNDIRVRRRTDPEQRRRDLLDFQPLPVGIIVELGAYR